MKGSRVLRTRPKVRPCIRVMYKTQTQSIQMPNMWKFAIGFIYFIFEFAMYSTNIYYHQLCNRRTIRIRQEYIGHVRFAHNKLTIGIHFTQTTISCAHATILLYCQLSYIILFTFIYEHILIKCNKTMCENNDDNVIDDDIYI